MTKLNWGPSKDDHTKATIGLGSVDFDFVLAGRLSLSSDFFSEKWIINAISAFVFLKRLKA